MTTPSTSTDLPRLVVLGCGFGGYSLLFRLRRNRWNATLLTPRNYFLFTPLLPSATAGSVEFRSILEPARRRLQGVRVIEGSADSVDWETRQVSCVGAVSGERFTIPFDLLVVAVGAAVADYGVPGVKEHTLKLASVEDARAVRRGILEQFARAEIPGLTPEQIRQRLTFVICGGGPTGVEVAAEIHDLIHQEIEESYPELAPAARVVLVEALDRLLTSFDEALSEYTLAHFSREGIEVRTSFKVKSIEPGLVHFADGQSLPCGLILWAAGNAPVPFIESLGAPLSPRGRRVIVDEFLRIPGREGAYALGDCAAVGDPSLPATAQVAQQQGKYLAEALERGREGKPVEPFRFKASGMLAYIGAGEALADLPQVKWSGRGAWLFWRSVYLTKLVSPANKVKVLFDWWKARLFGRDLSRF
ncbi:MAG TPA: FAD-dependent oxidoreductase [Thermoanaerobaculia bacterium]|nr:FAD-dependent oxidoreductase [Thermoanaerobaculia bacterium]